MLYFVLLVLLVIGSVVAWLVFDILGIGHRITRKKKYDKERSSSRESITGVLVELRRRVDSETPDWVNLAVNISRKGMLLHLPSGVGMGQLLYVGFTLVDHPRASFSGLDAVVIRRCCTEEIARTGTIAANRYRPPGRRLSAVAANYFRLSV